MNIKEIAAGVIDFIKGLMQPAITFVAIVVFLTLAKSGYDPDKIFAVVGVVILFWFGYTAIKNFNFNGKNGTEPPKANGGQAVNSTADAVNNTAVSADTVKLAGKGLGTFDRKKFIDEVYADVVGKYGKKNKNNCTVFYEAQDKISGVAAPWKFSNKQALREAWACVKDLAENAFFEIWGATYADALANLDNESGCPTCNNPKACTFSNIDSKARYMGMEYYAILRDYRRVSKTLADLG